MAFDETPITEQDIHDLYQEHLGRDADPEGLSHYFNSGWPLHVIEKDIKDSIEYFRKHDDPPFEVKYGADSHKPHQNRAFGGADYIQALIEGGPLNLERTYSDVLKWLQGDSGQKWLAPLNRRGQTNPEMPGGIGLFDRIEGAGAPNRDINPGWGDCSTDPEAGSFFTHDDLMATRAIGFREEEIKGVLDNNLAWLRSGDRPGVEGGVYESLYISQSQDDWTPGSPRVTRNPSEYDVRRTRIPQTRDIKDSLKINTGDSFVGKTARGVETAKRTRRRVRQTTDLQRSLNIS